MPSIRIDTLNEEVANSSLNDPEAPSSWEDRYVALFDAFQVGVDAFSLCDVPKALQTHAVREASAKSSPLAALSACWNLERQDAPKTGQHAAAIDALVKQGAITELMFWSMGTQWLASNHSLHPLAGNALARLRQAVNCIDPNLNARNMKQFVATLLDRPSTISPEFAKTCFEQLAGNPALCERYVSEITSQSDKKPFLFDVLADLLPKDCIVSANLGALPLRFIDTYNQHLTGNWWSAICVHQPAHCGRLEFYASLGVAHSTIKKPAPSQLPQIAELLERGVIFRGEVYKELTALCTTQGISITPEADAANQFLSKCSYSHFLSINSSHYYSGLTPILDFSTRKQQERFAQIVSSTILRARREPHASRALAHLGANILDCATSTITQVREVEPYTEYCATLHRDRLASAHSSHRQVHIKIKERKGEKPFGTFGARPNEAAAFRKATELVLNYMLSTGTVADLVALGICRPEQITWWDGAKDLPRFSSSIKRWLVRSQARSMSF